YLRYLRQARGRERLWLDISRTSARRVAHGGGRWAHPRLDEQLPACVFLGRRNCADRRRACVADPPAAAPPGGRFRRRGRRSAKLNGRIRDALRERASQASFAAPLTTHSAVP